MKKVVSFIFLMVYCSLGQAKTKILSPKEKIILLPYKDILTVTAKNDTIERLIEFTELGHLWIVGARNGIYLIDRQTKKIHKYLKFDIKSHAELFDGQDSLVGFNSLDFVVNKTKDKLLVIAGNGVVFQLDLVNYNVDWLIKFINRIATATYSDNAATIAIGTTYDYKSKSGRTITEYYASLFLIDSKSGGFIDYFNESASVKKILFKDSDSKLLVAYDWNYTDSYLWDINIKKQSIAQFRERDAFIYDISIINDSEFMTVNGQGISKWTFKNPNAENRPFVYSNTGSERILTNPTSHGFILIAYRKLFYFDHQLQVLDTVEFPIAFEDMKNSANDSLVILTNLLEFDKTSEGFYYFNLSTRKLTARVDKKSINELIQTNWH